MKNFEQRLESLEELTAQIRSGKLPLAETIAKFEEGIKLAKGLEKELEKMERRVEILVKGGEVSPATKDVEPNFDLFSDFSDDPSAGKG